MCLVCISLANNIIQCTFSIPCSSSKHTRIHYIHYFLLILVEKTRLSNGCANDREMYMYLCYIWASAQAQNIFINPFTFQGTVICMLHYANGCCNHVRDCQYKIDTQQHTSCMPFSMQVNIVHTPMPSTPLFQHDLYWKSVDFSDSVTCPHSSYSVVTIGLHCLPQTTLYIYIAANCHGMSRTVPDFALLSLILDKKTNVPETMPYYLGSRIC